MTVNCNTVVPRFSFRSMVGIVVDDVMVMLWAMIYPVTDCNAFRVAVTPVPGPVTAVERSRTPPIGESTLKTSPAVSPAVLTEMLAVVIDTAELRPAQVWVCAGVVVGSSKVPWTSMVPAPDEPDTVNSMVVALATGLSTITALVPCEESVTTLLAMVMPSLFAEP